MTNTTLEKMQEIEQAAEVVLASYEDQIKSLRDEQTARLEELSQVYDKETEASVLSLAKNKEEEIKKLAQSQPFLGSFVQSAPDPAQAS